MNGLLGDVVFGLLVAVPALALIATQVVSSLKSRPGGEMSGRGRRLLRS
jgi:hypothetical protein